MRKTRTPKPTSKNTAPRYGWALAAPTENQDGIPDGGWYIRSRVWKTKRTAERYRFSGEIAVPVTVAVRR